MDQSSAHPSQTLVKSTRVTLTTALRLSTALRTNAGTGKHWPWHSEDRMNQRRFLRACGPAMSLQRTHSSAWNDRRSDCEANNKQWAKLQTKGGDDDVRRGRPDLYMLATKRERVKNQRHRPHDYYQRNQPVEYDIHHQTWNVGKYEVFVLFCFWFTVAMCSINLNAHVQSSLVHTLHCIHV